MLRKSLQIQGRTGRREWRWKIWLSENSSNRRKCWTTISDIWYTGYCKKIFKQENSKKDFEQKFRKREKFVQRYIRKFWLINNYLDYFTKQYGSVNIILLTFFSIALLIFVKLIFFILFSDLLKYLVHILGVKRVWIRWIELFRLVVSKTTSIKFVEANRWPWMSFEGQ